MKNINKHEIIEWCAVWIIIPVYAWFICTVLWVIEIYENWRYGDKIEI
jgi:hypothetical protein